MKANVQKAPSFIEPMKALPVEALPEGDWLYEIKHDAYRALAFKEGKDVRLVSRNNKAFDYPQLLDALKLLLAQHFILKGEIACMANTCSPDFAAIFSCPTLRRRYLSWMKSLCGLQCLD